MSVNQESMAPEGVVTTTATPKRLNNGVVRVNLIPPEIAEARQLRTLQFGVVGAVVASLAAVALLYVQQTHAVSNAKSSLQAAQAKHTALEAEQTRLGNVNLLYAKVDAAKAMLNATTAPRILWSRYLEDIRLRLPEHVWLSTLSATETAPTAAVAVPAAAAGVRPVTPAGGAAATSTLGTLAFTGSGYTHRDVADLLDRLAGLRGVVSPYLTNSTETLVGAGTRVPTVNWSTTANLTQAALASADGRKG